MRKVTHRDTPLGSFVRQRRESMDLSQSQFCRDTGFDQGLLSKIEHGLVDNLILESALRLSHGLKVKADIIFSLINREEYRDIIANCYPHVVNQDKIDKIGKLITLWTQMQDHDRCWYYPDIFGDIVRIIGLEVPTVKLDLTKKEFDAGCKRFQEEEFNEFRAECTYDHSKLKLYGKPCPECGVVEGSDMK